MKNIIISPPFGNIISHKKCTSICGTFTLHKRGSNWTKIYKGLKTTKPIKGGWVNKVGLQNTGISSVKKFHPEKIYSITALQYKDWDKLFEIIPFNTKLELNLSCPNIDSFIELKNSQIQKYISKYPLVIFKLSPIKNVSDQIDRLVSFGAQYLHLSNTIPTARGGESGERLKQLSLKIIRKTHRKYPHVRIIGGGGIYSIEDINLYKSAGANYFSIASIWFNPLKALKFLKKI